MDQRVRDGDADSQAAPGECGADQSEADREESLVIEDRWHAGPAERVERRLLRMLRAVPVAISQVSASMRGRRRAPPEDQPGVGT